VELLHVQRNALGQRHQRQLGRAVVGLAEVADQARGGGHVHEGAALLLLEMVGGGAAHVVAAVQVHLEHGVPLVQAHLVEEAVAQDAGIVDHAVDAAEVVQRALHDAAGGRGLGHAVHVGHGLAAGGLDLFDHLLRGAGVRALARGRGADVVDHHLGAGRRQGQRHVAPNAAAGPRHHHHLVLHHLLRHVRRPSVMSNQWAPSMNAKARRRHSAIARRVFGCMKAAPGLHGYRRHAFTNADCAGAGLPAPWRP